MSKDFLIFFLLTAKGSIVVILLSHYTLVDKILAATSRHSSQVKINWVGVDAWSGRSFDSVDSNILNGAIAVQPLSSQLNKFDKYFTRCAFITINLLVTIHFKLSEYYILVYCIKEDCYTVHATASISNRDQIIIYGNRFYYCK